MLPLRKRYRTLKEDQTDQRSTKHSRVWTFSSSLEKKKKDMNPISETEKKWLNKLTKKNETEQTDRKREAKHGIVWICQFYQATKTVFSMQKKENLSDATPASSAMAGITRQLKLTRSVVWVYYRLATAWTLSWPPDWRFDVHQPFSQTHVSVSNLITEASSSGPCWN